MTDQDAQLSRRLKVAGGLISAGLLVEAASLYWLQALSFLAFAGVGTGLVAIGVALFLYSVAAEPAPAENPRD